ncbi:MAG: sulfurtransferase TusA family protein [Dermatophilaceae bacterium]
MSSVDGMAADGGHGDAPEDAVEVDARGLRCPLPVIQLARALDAVPGGQLVRLLATDPAARTDVPAFCRLRGAELLQVSKHGQAPGGHTAYLVRQVSATEPEAVRATPP